ncbi:MAG: hypothetical protein CMI26_02815 [Opitutae bacterium]|nr:hypothetical protein [Opitutae bacterium]|tara:strand:+ start:1895 stop:2455 length:561 start_codon:yes stop_codon:yes gene_type:complete
MALLTKKLKKNLISVGEIIEENAQKNGQVRIGEIILIREGRRRSFELIQLNPHNLEPIRRGDLCHYKRFRLNESRCKLLDKSKFEKKRSFRIGDVICKVYVDHLRYGRIVNFLHPDGLLTTSHEHGYNGKDFLECIEISSQSGLSRKIDAEGNAKRFITNPERCKICKVLPMDKKGGIRIDKPIPT